MPNKRRSGPTRANPLSMIRPPILVKEALHALPEVLWSHEGNCSVIDPEYPEVYPPVGGHTA